MDIYLYTKVNKVMLPKMERIIKSTSIKKENNILDNLIDKGIMNIYTQR